MSPNNYTAVVAIDFGTARTGYGFAYTSSPSKVYPNQTWPGAPPEAKTLTEVLLRKEDLAYVAFGYDARDVFAATDDPDKYLYFSTFKMALHNRAGATRGRIKATNCDVEIPVKQLISICIRVVKERAQTELSTSSTVRIAEDKIQWVLTVPAIWDIAARQVMMEAAQDAGIDKEHLIIALEPETAMLYSLNYKLEAAAGDLRGDTFMVVDAGGGTVDITLHRRLENGKIVEVSPPSGGNWGSTYVNKEFETLLQQVFGIDDATHRKNSDWFGVMDSFENVKINYRKTQAEPQFKNINILPIGQHPNLQNITRYDTETSKMIYANGILRIPSPSIQLFFTPIFDQITSHISSLLELPECQGLRYLFLVGGFAESPLLQNEINERFGSRVKVIIPPRPGSAVVIGAVHYGMDPTVISSRVAVRTIGVQVSQDWHEAVHKGRMQAMSDDGRRKCTECFDTFIRAGDWVGADSEVKKEYYPMYNSTTHLQFNIYASNKVNVPFTTDHGVHMVGFLDLEIPDVETPRIQRVTDVVMKFGGPVFTVKATYRKSGKSVDARFNFFLDNSQQIEPK